MVFYSHSFTISCSLNFNKSLIVEINTISRVFVVKRFLYALGIRHIGQQTASDISQQFENMRELWEYLQQEANGSS